MRFLQVVDDFYQQPDRVRSKALELPYSEPENLLGLRTQAFQPRGIRSLIEKKFKVQIKYWEQDLSAIEACNGVFFSSLSRGAAAERVGVHYDDPPNWMMLLIYMTPNAPFDAGTSLWQHRATGLNRNPTQTDARRLRIRLAKLEALLERDSNIRNRWIEIDRIGNVYNRAVLFPSGLLHSATRHFGSNHRTGRLYQSFHFSVYSRSLY